MVNTPALGYGIRVGRSGSFVTDQRTRHTAVIAMLTKAALRTTDLARFNVDLGQLTWICSPNVVCIMPHQVAQPVLLVIESDAIGKKDLRIFTTDGKSIRLCHRQRYNQSREPLIVESLWEFDLGGGPFSIHSLQGLWDYAE